MIYAVGVGIEVGKSICTTLYDTIPPITWGKTALAIIFAPAITREVTKRLPLSPLTQSKINKRVENLTYSCYSILIDSVKGTLKNAGKAAINMPTEPETSKLTKTAELSNKPPSQSAKDSPPAKSEAKTTVTEELTKWLLGESFKAANWAYQNFKHAPLDVVKGAALAVKDLLPPNVVTQATQITTRLSQLPLKYKFLGGTCAVLGTIGTYRYFRPASTLKAKAKPIEEERTQKDPEIERLKAENQQLLLGLMSLQKDLAQQAHQPSPQPVIVKQYFTGAQPQASATKPTANTQLPRSSTPPSLDEESEIDTDFEPKDATSVSLAISHDGKAESYKNSPPSSKI